MYVRATLFEVDTLRASPDEALSRFQQLVLPGLRQQPGYEGVLVLETPEGKGMLLSFWATAADAETSIESGFYDAQVAELIMLLRQPPGREHYEVAFHELNAALARDGGRVT
jgi:hypothetical protein